MIQGFGLVWKAMGMNTGVDGCLSTFLLLVGGRLGGVAENRWAIVNTVPWRMYS